LLDRKETEPSPKFAWFNNALIALSGWFYQSYVRLDAQPCQDYLAALSCIDWFDPVPAAIAWPAARSAGGSGAFLLRAQLPPVSSRMEQRTEAMREETSQNIVDQWTRSRAITSFAGLRYHESRPATQMGVAFVTLIDWDGSHW